MIGPIFSQLGCNAKGCIGTASGSNEAEPAKWCRGVARNLILHCWRSQRAAWVVADSEFLKLVDLALQENQDHWAERRQALMECINLLPEKSSQLLQMKYLEGLSFAAILS